MAPAVVSLPRPPLGVPARWLVPSSSRAQVTGPGASIPFPRATRVAVHSSDVKKLRALEMMRLQAFEGLTYIQIAERLKVSEKTVERTLTWGRRANLFIEAKDRVLQELVDPAISRARAELINADGTPNMDGDPNVAIKLLEGIGIIGTKRPDEGDRDSEGRSLADYIAEKRKRAQELEETVDGQLIEDAERLLADAQRRLDAPREDPRPAETRVSGPSDRPDQGREAGNGAGDGENRPDRPADAA
jgi:predicted DNA-binding protein (UPF0251 family)